MLFGKGSEKERSIIEGPCVLRTRIAKHRWPRFSANSARFYKKRDRSEIVGGLMCHFIISVHTIGKWKRSDLRACISENTFFSVARNVL